MSFVKISPSILSADFSKLGQEILDLEKAGADLIHIDVMDGHFVPNLTIGPSVIKTLRKYPKLPFDVHLMISPVHKYIENFAEAGADIITVHPESTDNLIETINEIKKDNKIVGDNTDIGGFEYGLKHIDYDVQNKKIFILGAGGVVPSIILALKKMGSSKIILSNRTKEKAKDLKVIN